MSDSALASPQIAVAHCCQQPLVAIAAALAAGIVFDRYWPTPIAVWIVASALAVVAWHFVRRSHTPHRHLQASAALLVAVAAFGGAWHHWHWNVFNADDIGRLALPAPSPAAVEAIVLSSPRFRAAPLPDPLRSVPQGPRTELRVEVTALRDGETWRQTSGKARLRVAGQLLGVHAGDTLRIFARLSRPDPPSNPGEFDFANHYRADRQLAELQCDSPNDVAVLASASPLYWRRVLGDVRAAGNRIINETIAPDRADLAAAVLLGSRERIDDEFNQDLLVTGTIHIISISGLHVGILASVLLAGFRWGLVPRVAAVICVAMATLGYTALTDSEPPAIRATVLVWVMCGALLLGRQALAFNTLALAAILVLLVNPADLFRPGTQLSFLSMAVLTWFAPWWSAVHASGDPLARLIRRTRPRPVRLLKAGGLGVVTVTTVGVIIWAITFPLVAHRFHVISFSALLLNAFLTLPVFVAMAAGFGMLALAWLLPPLGAVCGWICDQTLALIQGSIEWTASLPASHLWIGGPGMFWLLCFYAIVAALLIRPLAMSMRTRASLAGTLAATAVLLPFPQPNRAGELECGFIAVGHGCAVLLELPDGQNILYDAGRLGSPAAAARSVEGYFRSRQLSRLDALVISHADIDHFNAVPTLLEKFSIDRVYVSPQMFRGKPLSLPGRGQSEGVAAASPGSRLRSDFDPLSILRDAINRSGAELIEIAAGDRLPTTGDCTIDVLHPPRESTYGADNAHSIVLSVKVAGRCVLLTGDLEPPGVQTLVAQSPIDCDILLAPHHGSPRSDPDGIVNWCTPEYAVISSHFPLGDPRYEPYQRLLGPRALATSDTGAVRVRLGAHGVEVQTWRRDPW
jgi:competence protein ComEC